MTFTKKRNRNGPMNTNERFRGCLLGLAVGDAVGTTVEFRARGTFEPLTDMVGGGPFQLLPGQWTDDTSMALCLASSLVSLKNTINNRVLCKSRLVIPCDHQSRANSKTIC